jgi:glycosyltransferase involved in cell wall biosynthesis
MLDREAATIGGNASLGVSIVIPCLNEARTLPAVIAKSFEAIATLGIRGEVVVADNGSDDGSQAIARSAGCRVINVLRRGYGAALLAGIDAAAYSYVVMGDADDSYDFREAVPLVRQLQTGTDICIGSRLRGTIEPGAMPWKNRHVGTPTLTAIINLVYGARFSDANSGMRAFTKTAFNRLKLEANGMEFASEMLVKASILGLTVSEKPITLHKDGRDRPPHLRPWRDGWRHLKFILLFAPKILYWLPGTILLLIAAILTVSLNLRPGGVPVTVFGFPLNDHWVAVDALFWLVGFQLLTSGALLQLYTIVHRLQMRNSATDRFIRAVTIERILLCALVCLAGGIGLEADVINAWRAGGFVILDVIRPAVTGMMLIVTCVQLLTTGFFYAVLVEQYERLSVWFAKDRFSTCTDAHERELGSSLSAS